MFITSIKLTKQKMIGAVIIAGLLLCGLILWIAAASGGGSAADGGNASEVNNPAPSTRNIRTESDRMEFLAGHGWQVTAEGVQSQEVLIPATFDEVFERYNEMQRADGFDLSQYKNRRVMRYTYRVLNHPVQGEEVQATLLIYCDRIVGGDVCSLNQEGFMHGLLNVQNILPGSAAPTTKETAGDDEQEDDGDEQVRESYEDEDYGM